jgi:DNA polymerase-3 subunit alpha
MPEEYKTFDIKNWILSQCPDIAEYNRAEEELTEFERRNMLDLLRWLKYFVEFSRKNNILWGVGRGSSVSSYVLYLIGVHKIDPIKYNLDWQDFLR